MIGLIQRVLRAEVRVAGESIGSIGSGLLVFVGVQKTDNEAAASRLLERLLAYRVFQDADGRMNASLSEHGGGLLLVPQFTLPADTRKGTRASFTPAAPPELAEQLFASLADQARAAWPDVHTGQFAADMQVELVNDGPVTFWLEGHA